MMYLRLERTNLLLTWIGITLITPASFIGCLIINLLFLNVPGISLLIFKEGIPTLFTIFVISLVYSLYNQMREDSAESRIEAFDNPGFMDEVQKSIKVLPSYDSLVETRITSI